MELTEKSITNQNSNIETTAIYNNHAYLTLNISENSKLKFYFQANEKIENLFFVNNTIVESNNPQETPPLISNLTQGEFDEIILTRLITSGISIIACFFCVIIYLTIWVRKKLHKRKERKNKENLRLKEIEDQKNINNIDEDIFGRKGERFIPKGVIEHADNFNSKNHSLRDCNEQISFEQIMAQNKSKSLKSQTFQDGNGYPSINKANKTRKYSSEKQVKKQYSDFNELEPNLGSQNENLMIDRLNIHTNDNNLAINNNDSIYMDSKDNIGVDQEHSIDNKQASTQVKVITERNLYGSNIQRTADKLGDSDSDYDSDSHNNPSCLNESQEKSNSLSSSDTFAFESRTDKKIKIGIINNILILLIISNLGFCFASFFIRHYNDKDDNMPLIEISKCKSQAFLQNFFDLSAICLTTVISNILRCSQRQTYIILKKLKSRYKWYIIYSIIFPLGLTLGPCFTNSFGPIGPWCWIKIKYEKNPDDNSNDFTGITWSYLIYVFTWVNIFIISYKISRVIAYFNSRSQEIKFSLNKIQERKYIKKSKYIMYAFPLILIICKIPATINRCIVLILEEESAILYHFQAAFSCLCGFLHSIVFIYIHRRYIFRIKE